MYWMPLCEHFVRHVLSRFSHVQLLVTLWIVTCQALLTMEFSRQEYWSGLPFLPPGDLPDSGVEPESLTSLALAGGFFTTRPPRKSLVRHGKEKKENEALLDLSSKNLQSCSGAESICGAKIAVNAEKVTYKLKSTSCGEFPGGLVTKTPYF